jgi:hypothetical protein
VRFCQALAVIGRQARLRIIGQPRPDLPDYRLGPPRAVSQVWSTASRYVEMEWRGSGFTGVHREANSARCLGKSLRARQRSIARPKLPLRLRHALLSSRAIARSNVLHFLPQMRQLGCRPTHRLTSFVRHHKGSGRNVLRRKDRTLPPLSQASWAGDGIVTHAATAQGPC